jgi:hypothetical protein
MSIISKMEMLIYFYGNLCLQILKLIIKDKFIIFWELLHMLMDFILLFLQLLELMLDIMQLFIK